MLIVVCLSLSAHAKGYKFPINSEPYGMIKLGFGSSKQEVEPVFIYEIDGVDVGKKDHRVHLSPGTHTIKCKSTYDLNVLDFKIPKGQKFENTTENNTIEVTIEKDKSYYLGFSTKSEFLKDWKPVIFKVENIKKR